MSVSSASTRLGFASAPVLDVEAMLRRLPAEARARVAWTKKPVKDAVSRLRTEPLTDDLVVEVADLVIAAVSAIGQEALRTFADDIDEFQATLMSDLQREEERLRSFVAEEDAQDTVSRVIGVLRSFVSLAVAVPAAHVAPLGEAAWAQAVAASGMKPFLGGLVALMAAGQEAMEGGRPERARELIEVAYLQLIEFRDLARRNGLPLSAHPTETIEERRERLRRDADRLRGTLSDDDWRVLDEARLRDVR